MIPAASTGLRGRTLAIESATSRGSVALLDGASLVAEEDLPPGIQPSASFLSVVDAMLRAHGGGGPDRLARVAVSAGPGSFTGLRVGMAAAKGLCFGWGLPIVPVPTLHALAMRFPFDEGVVCPVLDARKKEVYTALFRWRGGECVRMSPDTAVAPQDLPALLPDDVPVLFCGGGAGICRPFLGDRRSFRTAAPPAGDSCPRASAVGLLAARIVRNGGAASPRGVVPAYLRASEAETKKAGGNAGGKLTIGGPLLDLNDISNRRCR